MQEDTEIITIRVPKSVKNKLEEKSKKQQQALNLTINKILANELEWDDYVSEMRWLQFDPTVIKEIFSHLNEDQIGEIAKHSKHTIISAIKFIYEQPTIENIIDFIESWHKASNISYRLTKNDRYKFTVTHDMGRNWSLFAVLLTGEFFSELGFMYTTISVESKSYSFEFDSN